MSRLFNFIAGAAIFVGMDSCADGRVDTIPAVGGKLLDVGIITFEEGVEAFNTTLRWAQANAPK